MNSNRKAKNIQPPRQDINFKAKLHDILNQKVPI